MKTAGFSVQLTTLWYPLELSNWKTIKSTGCKLVHLLLSHLLFLVRRQISVLSAMFWNVIRTSYETYGVLWHITCKSWRVLIQCCIGCTRLYGVHMIAELCVHRCIVFTNSRIGCAMYLWFMLCTCCLFYCLLLWRRTIVYLDAGRLARSQ